MLEKLRLGSRGSKLALWQAGYVKQALELAVPDLKVEIEVIKTTGDKILDVALSKIGDKGLFTKEIEKELLEGNIDIAVHSMKDLPSQIGPDLVIGAVLPRENPQDVLISKYNRNLLELPIGAVIGTSSLRRQAQIKHIRPDIKIVELRGNVETRIRKMQEEDLDAIILAYAGVKRLGFENLISEYLSYEVLMPAVGQGAIAVETRAGDSEVLAIVGQIDHEPTRVQVEAERSFLARLEGGCQVPIAAIADLQGQELRIKGLVASLDGQEFISLEMSGSPNQAAELGRKLGQSLLDAGAGPILNRIKYTGARE
ncbi:MAG: hydroxymethylbilane synthase [Syntrophomonadaceae bacterium]|jgi:hydroxymethylbilane synthase|nr:hydroxymethylbilane synthase [Syntrophomonadaceae bacterium]